jgi:hypothetical protein
LKDTTNYDALPHNPRQGSFNESQTPKERGRILKLKEQYGFEGFCHVKQSAGTLGSKQSSHNFSF